LTIIVKAPSRVLLIPSEIAHRSDFKSLAIPK